jgi:hypothetical protein
VTAVECAVNIRNAETALRVVQYTDIVPTGICEAKGKPTCNSPGFDQYIPARDLWYPHYSEFEAWSEAMAANPNTTIRKGASAEARRGPCGALTSDYVPGAHQNLYTIPGGEHAGYIVMCPACDDSSGEAQIVEKWAYIPGHD